MPHCTSSSQCIQLDIRYGKHNLSQRRWKSQHINKSPRTILIEPAKSSGQSKQSCSKFGVWQPEKITRNLTLFKIPPLEAIPKEKNFYPQISSLSVVVSSSQQRSHIRDSSSLKPREGTTQSSQPASQRGGDKSQRPIRTSKVLIFRSFPRWKMTAVRTYGLPHRGRKNTQLWENVAPQRTPTFILHFFVYLFSWATGFQQAASEDIKGRPSPLPRHYEGSSFAGEFSMDLESTFTNEERRLLGSSRRNVWYAILCWNSFNTNQRKHNFEKNKLDYLKNRHLNL